MTVIEVVVLLISGLALAAGVPAVLYFLLPQSVLESATRHGRYAGLGIRNRLSDASPGNGTTNFDSLLGQRA
jgi:hypothetical protein